MKTIVLITDNDIWHKALTAGEYAQSTLDSTLAEVGFIHCSFPDQTIEIVNRKFADRDNLSLLLVDVDKVKVPVKFEGALSGRAGIFAHIYGPLNTDAVYTVAPLQKNDQGIFISPPELDDANSH
jgi:uncharacterized protein (DUF952 family)